MKKILKKISNYFINLYYAIIGKKRVSKKSKGLFTEEDLVRVHQIMYLVDKIPEDELSEDQKQFIKNRLEINKAKDAYSKYIGYKKPPKELKKTLDAMNELDELIMTREMLGLTSIEDAYNKDNVDENKEKTSNVAFKDILIDESN